MRTTALIVWSLYSLARVHCTPLLARSESNVASWETDTDTSDDNDFWSDPPRIANFQLELPLEGTPQTPNARYKRTKYGPITVKRRSHQDEFVIEVPKPCEDCFITAFQTQLSFKNGTKANLDHGLQLRHMILYNTNQKDLVCPGEIFPMPARIHASNNQREVSRLNPGGALFGMKIGSKDKFSMSYNVTSESEREQVVYVQIIYEIVEGAAAAEYKNAQMAWIDLAGCQPVPLPDQPGAYAIRSPTWKATVGGKILMTVGHVSDGGTDVTLYINNSPVCSHIVMYGKKYGFMETGTNMQHITEISMCKRFGHVKVGDEVSIAAGFDSNKHPIMNSAHGGGEHMMAMSRIYITDGF